MSQIKVEQEDLQPGYTIIEHVAAILGVGTLQKTVIQGGHHPKMRLLISDSAALLATAQGPTEEASYSVSIVHATGGAVLDVVHKDGSIAGRAASTTSAGAIAPFAAVATTDEPTFEADEDVCILPSTAGGAATAANLFVLKFEVVD